MSRRIRPSSASARPVQSELQALCMGLVPQLTTPLGSALAGLVQSVLAFSQPQTRLPSMFSLLLVGNS